MQTSTTSTTFYPNKFYSFSSTLAGGTTYATSTNYIWNGDTLLATIDQKLINGTATGTPITRFIHPDHLGSTNAVTDQNGGLVQLMDYYPYGATRVSTSSYPTNEKRQYIDQFSDAQTGLNYLNARYYNSMQGQFLSEDSIFLGEPKRQDIKNPQNLNSYAYSADNPITREDPSGLWAGIASGEASVWGYTYGAGFAGDQNGIDLNLTYGVAAGVHAGVAAGVSSDNLDHQYSISSSGFVAFGDGLGGEIGIQDTQYPYSEKKTQASGYVEAGLGYGEATGERNTVTLPIVKWGAPTQAAQTLTLQQLLAQHASLSSYSSLPATVTSNGNTYYRNYSGLLSTTVSVSTPQTSSSASASRNSPVTAPLILHAVVPK